MTSNLIQFSKANLRNPVGVLTCPVAAAATFTEDYNITQLTEQIGCRSNKTLLAKLNNDSDFHHLTLEEARRITSVTGDLRIIKAWATGLDHQLIPAVPVAPSDEEFSDQLLLMAQRIGAFSSSMLEARSDGVITKADLAEIKRHAAKAIESIMQLELECEAQVRDWGTDTDV